MGILASLPMHPPLGIHPKSALIRTLQCVFDRFKILLSLWVFLKIRQSFPKHCWFARPELTAWVGPSHGMFQGLGYPTSVQTLRDFEVTTSQPFKSRVLTGQVSAGGSTPSGDSWLGSKVCSRRRNQATKRSSLASRTPSLPRA